MVRIALDSERPHHKKALQSLVEQLQPVFDTSTEGVFVYLDGEHKSCNDRLAGMFGYSPIEWEALYPFEKLLADESREDVMSTYYEKIIGERAPAQLQFTGVKKDGTKFSARILMVPLSYDNLVFALCFVK